MGCSNQINAIVLLTVINSEESPGVVFVFHVFASNILAQEVQCLVSAMARHLITRNHLQQGEKNGFQVFRGICRWTDDIKGCISALQKKIHTGAHYSNSHSLHIMFVIMRCRLYSLNNN